MKHADTTSTIMSQITSNYYQNVVGGPLLSSFMYRNDDKSSFTSNSIAMQESIVKKDNSGSWMQLNDVLKFLNIYYTLFIIIVGLLGNTASLAVFLGTHLRSRSSSYYLAAVSIADSGFLLCLLSVWFTYLDINIYNRQGGCQIVVYLTYVFSFASVWLIVAFTLERFIAICFPLDRPSVCTIRRAKTNIALVAVGGVLFYSFVLVTAGIVQQPHNIKTSYPTTHVTTSAPFRLADVENLVNSIREQSLDHVLLDRFDTRTLLEISSINKLKRGVFNHSSEIDLNDESTGNNAQKLMREPECAVKPLYLNSMNIFNHIDTFITLFIPFAILILLNVLICRKIVLFKRRYYRNRKSETEYRDSLSMAAVNSTEGPTSTAYFGSIPQSVNAVLTRNGAAVRLCNSKTNAQRLSSSNKKGEIHIQLVNMPFKHGGIHHHHHSFPDQHLVKYPKESFRSSATGSDVPTSTTPQPSCSSKRLHTQRKSLLIRHNFNNNIFAKTQMSITKLLLIISTVFLVLNFPSYILRMRVYIMNLAAKDYENSDKYQMLENLFQLLYYTNFSVNFLLYSVCGTNFRRALMRLFKIKCNGTPEN